MFPIPLSSILENTLQFETKPYIAPQGFREYDARWLIGKEINLMGAQLVGFSLGTIIRDKGERKVIVGHDYRSYSQSFKLAFVTGLVAAGCQVKDIGLCITPMAYFAQAYWDINCVAMITASHNENGWTGLKMGILRPLTLGPKEMKILKTIALSNSGKAREGGSYEYVTSLIEVYKNDLLKNHSVKPGLKVAVSVGNGTPAMVVPYLLKELGCKVVSNDLELDYTFPHFNPNPESMEMMDRLSVLVRSCRADVGIALDGDGDRCGVVDEKGSILFSDKMGLLIARNMVIEHPDRYIFADTKSTSLFVNDPVLLSHGAKFRFIQTGHSYAKMALKKKNGLIAVERSGHFFFGSPIGRGYDDGLVSMLMVLKLLDKEKGITLSSLANKLPYTWCSPTIQINCIDATKYEVVGLIIKKIESLIENNSDIFGAPIVDLSLINGARFSLADGTWGLVRASSNKPELVVVVESPNNESQMNKVSQRLINLANYYRDLLDNKR